MQRKPRLPHRSRSSMNPSQRFLSPCHADLKAKITNHSSWPMHSIALKEDFSKVNLRIGLRFVSSMSTLPKRGPNGPQVTLEPSSFTQEKFDLYCKYQRDIHNDQHNSPGGFKRFLVESPLAVRCFSACSSAHCLIESGIGGTHSLYHLPGSKPSTPVIWVISPAISR